MKKVKILFLVGVLALMPVTAWSFPTLYVNSVAISPLAGALQDLTMTFGSSPQVWTLMYEITPHSGKNTLYYYTDLWKNSGDGLPRTKIFDDNNNIGDSKSTSIGSEFGLILFNDVDDNGILNSGDSYLVSERALTVNDQGSNEHQWFMAYNVSAYGSASFFFDTYTEDLSFTGNYDYLIFIDDDHTYANFDHNDMVVGVNLGQSVVPEPATLLLLGSGLLGCGAVSLRRKK